MVIRLSRLPIMLVALVSLFLIQSCSAQNRESDEEITWYDALQNEPRKVEPKNIELLSIQVSKLPRDTFGHGKPPWGESFVSSFVAASGTGIYGVFKLDAEGDLKYREELSSVEKFTDDRGTDLTTYFGDKEINEFFDSNKKLSIKQPLDQNSTETLFTIRGYSTPAKGASTLHVAAKITFLSLSDEKSATVKTKVFGTSDTIEVGPVAFRVAKNSGQPDFRVGRTRWAGDNKKDWALILEERKKPVKRIEVLDQAGNVLWKASGLLFDGKSYTHYMESLGAQPNAVRVTWYEKWELITVPIKIETPLGI